jgi:terminase small subunit-like protein
MSANGNGAEHSPTKSKRARTGLYIKDLPGLRLRDIRVAIPWLEPADFPAVRAWCELEYLAERGYATLRTMGVINQQTGTAAPVSELRQLRQAQLAYARELGMTPAARMAIKATGAHTAFDLPAEMKGGRVAVQ